MANTITEKGFRPRQINPENARLYDNMARALWENISKPDWPSKRAEVLEQIKQMLKFLMETLITPTAFSMEQITNAIHKYDFDTDELGNVWQFLGALLRTQRKNKVSEIQLPAGKKPSEK